MTKTPELKKLKQLKDSIAEKDSQITDDLTELRENVSALKIDFDLTKLEKKSLSFLTNELTKINFFQKIQQNNSSVSKLLQEVNFFNHEQNYLTGFFSHQFSSQDEKKWKEIEQSLDSIYNYETGLLRSLQDFFLFQISKEQLAIISDHSGISFEEELFLRSILIKSYLTNFRQLILPFYEIDDEILIKFKKTRISQLKSSKDEHSLDEMKLLQNQVEKLELQLLKNSDSQQHSENKFKITSANITAYNTSLNTSSVILGSVETLRYITSSIGHRSGIEALKTAGNFGLKTGGFLARSLPVLSVLAEAGTQMNNNYVVYNYEKKLRILSLVDNTKRNLLILEQQVTDYYVDNILQRLQTILLEKQEKTQQIIARNQTQQLIKQKQRATDREIEAVQKEYYSNIDLVRQGVEQSYQTKISEKEILHQNRLAEKDSLLIQQEQTIEEKETRLAELDQEIFAVTSELEMKQRQLSREINEKNREINKLDNSLKALSENLSFQKELLAREQQTLSQREQALNESLKGNISAAFQASYDYEVAKRKEFEITLNVLLKQKNELTQALNDLKSNLLAKENELISEREYWESLNEKLSANLSKIKQEKQSLLHDKQIIQKELNQKLDILNQKYNEIDNQHTLLKIDQQILEAAKIELIRDKDREIAKCNKYRKEIEELEKKVAELMNLNSKIEILNKENNKLAKVAEENKQLRDLLQTWRSKYQELEIKQKDLLKQLKEAIDSSYQTKLKLMTILTIDTSRNFLPKNLFGFKIHQSINNFESIIFVSELAGLSSFIWIALWFSMFLVWLYGLISLLNKLGKKIFLKKKRSFETINLTLKKDLKADEK